MRKTIEESFVVDMFWCWLKATRYYKQDFLLEMTESSRTRPAYELPSYKSQTLAHGLFFWLVYLLIIGVWFVDIGYKFRWDTSDLLAGLGLLLLWTVVAEICGLIWVFTNMGAGFGHWIGRSFAKSIIGYWLIAISTGMLFWAAFGSLVIGLGSQKRFDFSEIMIIAGSFGLFHLLVMFIWLLLYGYTVYFSRDQDNEQQPKPISSGDNLDEHLLDGNEDI